MITIRKGRTQPKAGYFAFTGNEKTPVAALLYAGGRLYSLAILDRTRFGFVKNPRPIAGASPNLWPKAAGLVRLAELANESPGTLRI